MNFSEKFGTKIGEAAKLILGVASSLCVLGWKQEFMYRIGPQFLPGDDTLVTFLNYSDVKTHLSIILEICRGSKIIWLQVFQNGMQRNLSGSQTVYLQQDRLHWVPAMVGWSGKVPTWLGWPVLPRIPFACMFPVWASYKGYSILRIDPALHWLGLSCWTAAVLRNLRMLSVWKQGSSTGRWYIIPIAHLFDNSYSNMCRVIAHCSYYLLFPYN